MNTFKRWEATLYHDEPEDAATDSKFIGLYRTRQQAIAAIKAKLSDQWQSGQVSVGTLHLMVLGVSPARFERDENARSWLVGPDHAEQG